MDETFGLEDEDRGAKRRKKGVENEPKIEEKTEFPEMEGLVTRLRRKGGLPPRTVNEEADERKQVPRQRKLPPSSKDERETIEEFVQKWMRNPENEGRWQGVEQCIIEEWDNSRHSEMERSSV